MGLVVRVKKRDSVLIILDILRVLRNGPANITRVVYQSNLNHSLAGKYLSLLAERGMVTASRGLDGRLGFIITDHGREVLRLLEDGMSRLLSEKQAIVKD